MRISAGLKWLQLPHGLLLAGCTLVLVLVLLAQPSLICGQGLDVSDEQLGFSAAATATEFKAFEDLMLLSTTGGRGRGGRGGSGNLGNSFKSSIDLQQLQQDTYFLGSIPPVFNSFDKTQTPGNINYVPLPRDQGTCNTCVGMAVAVAVQMSVAFTTRTSVDDLAVSPGALYYCTPGGRTCKTGWDIPAALRALEVTPQWLIPSKCLVDDPSKEAKEFMPCRSVSETMATRANHSTTGCKSTFGKLAYPCSYKSLSSFVEIEQHIRTHGAAITRVIIPDDFNFQFNASIKKTPGRLLPPYSFNASAKALFGHAALIVGYDNENFTFTILNSWGKNSNDNIRQTGGVTADGMFKVQMGLLGIGTPDFTYGVICEPATGTDLNPYGEKPYLRNRRRPVIRSNITAEVDRGCFTYVPTQNDTVASVVDHFGLDMLQFVQKDNIFRVAEQAYKFDNVLNLGEIKQSLKVMKNHMEQLKRHVKPKRARTIDTRLPYFECLFYDSSGRPSKVFCNLTNAAACALGGTVGCTLHYVDYDVTTSTTDQWPGENGVAVCREEWKNDNKALNLVAYQDQVGDTTTSGIRAQQEVALRRIMQAINPSLTYKEAGEFTQCTSFDENTYNEVRMQQKYVNLAIICNNQTQGPSTPYDVIALGFTVVRTSSDTGPTGSEQPNLDENLLYALLDLVELRTLKFTVNEGQLYPQLAYFSQLVELNINHYCLTGTLPENLLDEKPENLLDKKNSSRIKYLTIKRGDIAIGAIGRDGQCGIAGTIPGAWLDTSKLGGVNWLDLGGNMLTGWLPPQLFDVAFPQYLYLNANRFSGTVPGKWGTSSGAKGAVVIDLSDNLLEGNFPNSWRNLSGTLQELQLNGNERLTGCISVRKAIIGYSETGIAGRCTEIGDLLVEKQKTAVEKYLVPALASTTNNNTVNVVETIKTRILQKLGTLTSSGQPMLEIVASAASGTGAKCSVKLEVIDGIDYITSIYVQLYQPAAEGLNLTNVEKLAEGLPRLMRFWWWQESISASLKGEGDIAPPQQLPMALPSAAPQLLSLTIYKANLVGELPSTYSNWSSIEFMDFTLNSLEGALPEDWGTGTMKPGLQLLLAANLYLTGNIPSSWVDKFNPGYIDVRLTLVTCPDPPKAWIDCGL